MTEEEIMEWYKKFVTFAGDKGFHVSVPGQDAAFMNNKGDVMILAGKKSAIIVKRGEVEDANFTNL